MVRGLAELRAKLAVRSGKANGGSTRLMRVDNRVKRVDGQVTFECVWRSEWRGNVVDVITTERREDLAPWAGALDEWDRRQRRATMDYVTGQGRKALFGLGGGGGGGKGKRKASAGTRRLFKEPGPAATRHRLYSPGKASESYHMSRSPPAKSKRRDMFDFY